MAVSAVDGPKDPPMPPCAGLPSRILKRAVATRLLSLHLTWSVWVPGEAWLKIRTVAKPIDPGRLERVLTRDHSQGHRFDATEVTTGESGERI